MKIIRRTILAATLALASSPAAAQAIAFLANLKGDVALDGTRGRCCLRVSRGQKLAWKGGYASVMYIPAARNTCSGARVEFQGRTPRWRAPRHAAPVRNTEWRTSSKCWSRSPGVVRKPCACARSQAPRREGGAAAVPHRRHRLSTLQPTLRWQAPESKQPARSRSRRRRGKRPCMSARTGAAIACPPGSSRTPNTRGPMRARAVKSAPAASAPLR